MNCSGDAGSEAYACGGHPRLRAGRIATTEVVVRTLAKSATVATPFPIDAARTRARVVRLTEGCVASVAGVAHDHPRYELHGSVRRISNGRYEESTPPHAACCIVEADGGYQIYVGQRVLLRSSSPKKLTRLSRFGLQTSDPCLHGTLELFSLGIRLSDRNVRVLRHGTNQSRGLGRRRGL